MRGAESVRHAMIGTILLVGISASGSAQNGQRTYSTPFGSRIPRWEETPPPTELNSVTVLRRFSSCIALKKRAQAIQLLSTYPGSVEEEKAIGSVAGRNSECLKDASQMRLTVALFRGSIAEAVYKNYFPIMERLYPQPLPMEYGDFKKVLKASDQYGDGKQEQGTREARWISYCTVHENPMAVERVLYTEIGSVDETNAVHDLTPTISGCLFQDQSVDFSRLNFRAFLADGLYRMRFKIDGRF